MLLTQLTLANLRHHLFRTGLAVAAVALAVSLVIAVTSGYATLEAAANRIVGQFIGQTDAMIGARGHGREGGVIPGRLLREIAADPAVQTAAARLEWGVNLTLPVDGIPQRRETQVVGVDPGNDPDIRRLELTAGAWFEGPGGDGMVVDQQVADSLKLNLGDTLELPGLKGTLPLKVSGIVHKPSMMAAIRPTVYAPLEAVQRFALGEEPDRLTRILVVLNPAADPDAFSERWTQPVTDSAKGVSLRMAGQTRAELKKNLSGLRVVSYLGGVMSLLTASFIVVATLAMGLVERQRVLAMLRAIGASKPQVAGVMFGEAVAIALMGVGAGVPLGWLWLRILISLPALKQVLQPVGVVFSPGGLLLATLGATLIVVAAGLLPAIAASRVDPLSAMAPLAKPPPRGFPWKLTLIGGGLALVDLVLLNAPIDQILARVGLDAPAELARTLKFYQHFFLGTPALLIGFLLLAPGVVWLIERYAAGPVAKAMGVLPELLRQQLSGSLWRSAGTAAALMIGLAGLVAMQIQGTTMLSSWRLPNRFPDVFIFSRTPIGPADQERLGRVEGIKPGELMPVAIASPEFGGNLFALMLGTRLLPDATMFFGVDPAIASDMLQLDFRDRQGKSFPIDQQDRVAREAMAQLKLGRHAIVTDEFRQLKGVWTGDTIPLKTVNGVKDYTIAGVVWSPGLDVITKRFDLGSTVEQRTAASVFGSLADAKEDFGVDGVYLLAANIQGPVERPELVTRLSKQLASQALSVVDIRQIKYEIQSLFETLLKVASRLAFAAMAVSSLGVANAVMASVRSRRWQFGVLRSIGLTRGQLLRLVVGEAALLGLAACGLGLIAGLAIAVNAKSLTRITLGYNPSVVIPWDMIALGAAMVLAVSILAGLYPAISTARTSPLRLLSAGRAG